MGSSVVIDQKFKTSMGMLDALSSHRPEGISWGACLLLTICAIAVPAVTRASETQVGIIAFEQIADRAGSSLSRLYAAVSEDAVTCSRRRKTAGHGGFLFECSLPASSVRHLWFAFTRDGERIELAPATEATATFLASAGMTTSPSDGGVQFVPRLGTPLDREVSDFVNAAP